MNLKQDKYHLLVSGYKHKNIRVGIGEIKICESSKQNSLGVVIDTDLSFDKYVSSLCKKDGRELSVLSRLPNLMSFQQRRLLMKSFVEDQFEYCPLVWIPTHCLQRLQQLFQVFTKKDNSICIHHRSTSLAVELFKVGKNFSNTIRSDIFPIRVLNYSLRSKTDFFRNTANTTKFGLNSLRYFTSKIWSMIPIEIKISATVEMFKSKINN